MSELNFQPDIPAPYLVYLGDVTDEACCKTGFGMVHWASERTIGQFRSNEDTVSVGQCDMTFEEAVAAGAKSLIIGIADFGGRLAQSWHGDLIKAANAGLNIVSGGHEKLAEIPGLAEAAAKAGVKLVEIRNSKIKFPVGTGIKRSGRRLLTVGTDCALGKKYTALTIANEMRARGINADYRATGQTGIMIAGNGVPIDSIISDFLSGAAEALSPDASADHWDIIEGQGSLIHPGYAGVTLGLLHGSQPDEIVLCHDPRLKCIQDYPHVKIPPLTEVIELYLVMGRLTNPKIRCSGISLNTQSMTDKERRRALARVREETGLIVFDPLITGAGEFIDYLEETSC
jgi:uncharacterized NAD-dependent epimerase/dehydratase family protein